MIGYTQVIGFIIFIIGLAFIFKASSMDDKKWIVNLLMLGIVLVLVGLFIFFGSAFFGSLI